MQNSFASGLNLAKLQLSSFARHFSRSTSYPISLSRWPNSSTSIASLYFRKYRSILYFPTPNWWIISSPVKACMICLRMSCSLHNHLFLWSSAPARPASIFRLRVGFLHLLITYKRLLDDRKISILLCWSFGPGQPPCHGGLPLCLSLRAFYTFLRHSMMSEYPVSKNFPTWVLSNQFCSSLSTSISISLRLNSSHLLLPLETFNKKDIFIFNSFWVKKFLYSLIKHKKGLYLWTQVLIPPPWWMPSDGSELFF